MYFKIILKNNWIKYKYKNMNNEYIRIIYTSQLKKNEIKQFIENIKKNVIYLIKIII